MRKLKTGTFVALDKNFKNICVGDHIRDTEGRIFDILPVLKQRGFSGG